MDNIKRTTQTTQTMRGSGGYYYRAIKEYNVDPEKASPPIVCVKVVKWLLAPLGVDILDLFAHAIVALSRVKAFRQYKCGERASSFWTSMVWNSYEIITMRGQCILRIYLFNFQGQTRKITLQLIFLNQCLPFR